MGCIQSNSIGDQNRLDSNNKSKWFFKSEIKSNVSITSMKSTFSRKRTKRSKKSIKLNSDGSLGECDKQNDPISLKRDKHASNVQLRQTHKKTSIQDIIELNSVLSQHCFFFKLNKQQKISFIEQLKLYEIRKGKHVYEKNDSSNRLYIVKAGLLQIQTFNENVPRYALQKKNCFGQIDLLMDVQRSQSVVAKQNSKLWALQKQKFDQLREQVVNQGCSLSKTYLQKVSTLSYLSEEEIELICQKMYLLKFPSGRTIFSKGDPSQYLFIIISGEVELKIPNKNNIIIKAGDVFGEACLKLNPTLRAGTAICLTECRCLVISGSNFTKCLGGNNIENIAHFSILKWAFKRSLEFKDESSVSLYKHIQKGKIVHFKDQSNIFENDELFPNYYVVSLEGHVNQHAAGVLINCLKSDTKSYTKHGDGNVFLLQIKKSKGLGKSLKMVKFLQKKQCDLRIPLSHISKHEQFIYQDLQSFMQNLIMVRRVKSLQSDKGDYYNVWNKTDGRLYNIWCAKKCQISTNKLVEVLVNEKAILTKAKLCNFLSCLHKTYHDDHHIYFIFKHYSNGNLEWLLQKHTTFDSSVVLHLCASLIVGIQYMHMKMKVVHRNITVENIFMDEFGYFCVDNFQNAKHLTEKDTKTRTIVGTPHYFAPEMIDGKSYSFEVDYWALGVVLYRVIYGKFPFNSSTNDPFDIFKHIIKNNLEFRTNQKGNPEIVQFTRLLLSTNPKTRTNNSINGLRSHSLFEQLNWEQFEKKNVKLPFSLETFGMKKVDRKFYEDGRNYFSNFISKEKKKLSKLAQRHLVNFKSWDIHFD